MPLMPRSSEAASNRGGVAEIHGPQLKWGVEWHDISLAFQKPIRQVAKLNLERKKKRLAEKKRKRASSASLARFPRGAGPSVRRGNLHDLKRFPRRLATHQCGLGCMSFKALEAFMVLGA